MVERFLDAIRTDYAGQCKGIDCGFWSEAGRVELRLGFTTTYDGKRHETVVSMPAGNATSDTEREAYIAAAIASFREVIDDTLRPELPNEGGPAVA